MRIEQQLPFGFKDDVVLDLEHVTDFDDMIYNPKGYALEVLKRPQLNVSNQNKSTSRIVKPPITKGNPASWGIFALLTSSLINHYRDQIGSDRRTNLSEPYSHLAYAELTIDKKTKAIDWTTLFTVTTDQAPVKAVDLDLNHIEKVSPNSKTKPWVDQPWQQVDNGAFIPPPVKSLAYTMQTENTERFCDTVLVHLNYVLNGAGYHVIDKDRSLIMIYGPSTEHRKIGIRLCHLEFGNDELFEGIAQFRKELNAIILPGITKSLGPADVNLIKQQFKLSFVADPLNREMFGSLQFHTCPGKIDKDVISQLWSDSFSERIRLATKDLKKNSSPAVFKLFISNLKNLKEQSHEFKTFNKTNVPDITNCTKCKLDLIYSRFIESLILLHHNVNVNTIKDIIGEDHLVKILNDLNGMQGQLRLEDQPKGKSLPRDSHRLRALMFSASVGGLVDSSIFKNFSEARKASILKSIYDSDDFIGPAAIDLKYYLDDTNSMLQKVDAHQHSARGIDEIKKRDIRSLKSLHDELSYIMQILDTIPKDIKNHQYDFLRGKCQIPFTSLEIKIPQSNIDIKSWGTKQRHCIGSYADDVLAERRTVIGIWDKDKKDWLGHMSLHPILVKGTKPNKDGKLDAGHLMKYKLEIQQFYGKGNTSIEKDPRNAVIEHVEKVLSNWLFDVVVWDKVGEEVIEANDALSLTRSEKKLFKEIRLADGRVAIKQSNEVIYFNHFRGLVENAVMQEKRKSSRRASESHHHVLDDHEGYAIGHDGRLGGDVFLREEVRRVVYPPRPVDRMEF